jgi:hypothetical protein
VNSRSSSGLTPDPGSLVFPEERTPTHWSALDMHPPPARGVRKTLDGEGAGKVRCCPNRVTRSRRQWRTPPEAGSYHATVPGHSEPVRSWLLRLRFDVETARRERGEGGGMQQEGWEVGEMINKGVEGNAMPWHLHVACSRLTVEAQAPL